MSDIKILNSNLEVVGIIDNYNSLMLVKKYYTNGTFTVKLPLNDDYIKVLKKNNIIFFDDFAGFIETVEFDMADDGETITLIGKELLAYLARRINSNVVNFNGTVENFARRIVNDNCIAAATTERIMQNSYGNLLEILNGISQTSNIGFKISFNYKDKKLIFDCYKGADRTVNQSILAPLIFSRDYENIMQQTYIESINTYANSALIAGMGEDVDRKITFIESGTGLDRYEIFVDARDLQNTVNSVVMTDEDYVALLKQRGIEKLSDYYSIATFDSTVNTIVTSDFNVGDIVTVNDRKWGITLDTRITEIQEIYENGGKTINVTFGNNVPTIYKKLKKGMI